MSLTLKSTKVEVAAASMAELVAFVNEHSGKPPIKKFETRAKGVERATALIAAKAEGSVSVADLHKSGHPIVEANKASWPSGKPAKKDAGKLSFSPGGSGDMLKVKKPATPSAAEHMARVLASQGAHPSTAKPATKSAKPAAKSAKPAAPKKAGGGRASFTEDAIITVVHKGDSPKRGTAADRYALYRNGMTVAAYIAAGGQRRDVVWDQKMGWITVAEPK